MTGKNKRYGGEKTTLENADKPSSGFRGEQMPSWTERGSALRLEPVPTTAQPEKQDDARPAGTPGDPRAAGTRTVSASSLPHSLSGYPEQLRKRELPGTAGCHGRGNFTSLPLLVGRHVGLTVANCRKLVVKVGFYCCSSRAEDCFWKVDSVVGFASEYSYF